MKVLHLVQDTPFINDHIEIISTIDDINNHDILVYYTPTGNFEKLKNFNEKTLGRVKYRGTDSFSQALDSIKDYDKVFIHYLTYEMSDFIKKIPKNLKVFW